MSNERALGEVMLCMPTAPLPHSKVEGSGPETKIRPTMSFNFGLGERGGTGSPHSWFAQV